MRVQLSETDVSIAATTASERLPQQWVLELKIKINQGDDYG
jgi:hypothetical protein